MKTLEGKTKDGKAIVNSLKISELIKELVTWEKVLGDVEVFVVNPEKQQFDGVTQLFTLKTAKGDVSYLSILASGDILKI